MSRSLNIADRLSVSATSHPHQRAVVYPESRDAAGRVCYSQLTFRQLDQEVDDIARGLIELGVQPGDRLALFVPPSLESIALTFGVFRAGAVGTLIDPGMGRSNVFRCLDQCPPDGFIAIPLVHLVRRLKRSKYKAARFNVTVGKGLAAAGVLKYADLVLKGAASTARLPQTKATDSAAIIFTSGSTGPPKGVCYEHGMFDAQVGLIRDRFGIQPGEIDLPGFPLFALFNIAMQVTTVIPDMDPTRPANIDPLKFIEAMEDQGITQAFGSPALWNTVGRHCEAHNVKFPTLKRILSAGAPVPNHVLQRMLKTLPDEADIFTPYGATECLPVAAIGGREVLAKTAVQTAEGAGTCVGDVFDQMSVKIIKVNFEPIDEISKADEMSTGEIGEIIVRGPVATREYFQRPDGTALAKIKGESENSFWHRMGDVGYLDDDGRLWFCGRKAHIVFTESGPLYSVRCEAIFNQHPDIYRSALVGIGNRKSNAQRPAIVCEPEPGQFPETAEAKQKLKSELRQRAAANPLTDTVQDILFHQSLPVDTRHNVKINREALAVWATSQ